MKIFFILISFILLFSTNTKAEEIGLSNWEYSWGNKDNWKKVILPSKIPDRTGNLLYLKIKVPKFSNKNTNKSLFLQSVNQVFDVYIDNDKIYSYGNPDNYEFKGYPFHIIPLRKIYIGKNLILKIYSEHKEIGINGYPYIDNELNIITNILKKNILKFSTGILLLLLGIMFISVYFIQRSDKNFLFFSLYSMTYGISIICGNSLSYIFFKKYTITLYTELLSIYILPIFFILFFESFFKDKNTFILRLNRIIYSFFFLITVYMITINRVPIMETLDYMKILIIISLVISSVFFIKEKVYKDIFGKIVMISFLILSVFIFYDVYISMFYSELFNGYTYIGLFIFNISLANIIGINYLNLSNKINKYLFEIEYNKKTEEKLKEANQIAINASNAKSSFLANMTHEIRTPISGIIGISELLKDTNLDDTQKNYIKIIKSSSNSLLSLVNDILDFSKIESGKMELDNISCNLNDCIENSLDAISIKASEKNLDLFYYIQADAKSIILCDCFRLRQVLINILSNSIKFTEKGEVYIDIYRVNNNINFKITDTGIGIEESKKDRLFNSFTQVEAGTTKKYGGTGLGLVISKKIINLMGGDINFISEFGKGTSFYFSIKSEKIEKENIINKFPDKVYIIGDNKKSNIYLQKTLSDYFFNEVELLADLNNISKKAIIFIDINYDCNNESILNKISTIDNNNIILLLPLKNLNIKVNSNILKISKPIKYSDLDNTIQKIYNKEDKNINLVNENIPIQNNNKYKILVAEDNSINQMIIKNILKKLGYDCTIANNGLEAIEEISKNKYDIIFMDIQMPIINGLEATSKIIDLDLEHKPIILALTANASKEDKENCLNAGMNDYLTKPFTIDNIKNALDKWLN